MVPISNQDTCFFLSVCVGLCLFPRHCNAVFSTCKSIKKPLMLHVAQKDQFVPEEDRDKVMAALGAHSQVKLKLYEGQDHAFARPGGEHYNQDAAELANGRTIGFFREHLN